VAGEDPGGSRELAAAFSSGPPGFAHTGQPRRLSLHGLLEGRRCFSFQNIHVQSKCNFRVRCRTLSRATAQAVLCVSGVQVLIAMAIAVALGYLSPGRAVAMKPLGDAFIRLITMIITVLIFCTVTGIAGMQDQGAKRHRIPDAHHSDHGDGCLRQR